MYLLLIFVLTLILPLTIMPKYIRLGILKPYKVVLLSVTGVCMMAVIVMMVAAMTGQGLYAQLVETARIVSEEAASNPQMKEMLEAAGIANDDFAETLLYIYSKGFLLVPTGILFMSAVVSYVEYIILTNTMSKKGEAKKMPKFREFSFPYGTAMAVMLMYIIGWIMMDAETHMGEMLYANFSAIFDLVFVLQGIAVVLMFFHLKRIHQAIAVIVCVLMCVTSLGKTFMVLIGMADIFLGLRIRMSARASKR